MKGHESYRFMPFHLFNPAGIPILTKNLNDLLLKALKINPDVYPLLHVISPSSSFNLPSVQKNVFPK